jgi:hypothetical protein
MKTNQSICYADIIKTICHGALGGLTFGMFHKYQTDKQMKLHNEQMELHNKQMKIKHQQAMNRIDDELNTMNDKVTACEKFWTLKLFHDLL